MVCELPNLRMVKKHAGNIIACELPTQESQETQGKIMVCELPNLRIVKKHEKKNGLPASKIRIIKKHEEIQWFVSFKPRYTQETQRNIMVCEFRTSGESRKTFASFQPQDSQETKRKYNDLRVSRLRKVKKHKEIIWFVSFQPQESQETQGNIIACELPTSG